MARSLKNKPQVQAPTASYPYGRIKDDTGLDDGTPVNEDVYGDMHQFFESLLNEAGIVANELPENEYDGFQYLSALKQLLRTKRKIIDLGNWNMNASNSLTVAHSFDRTKIRSISVWIRDDSGTNYYDLFRYDTGSGNVSGGITNVNAGFIGLIVTAGGFFNTNAAFDGTGFSRGKMTVEYEE